MGITGLNVVIRVDASVSIGMGHRVRCEVLANAFAAQGAIITFVVHASCADFAQRQDVLFEQESEWQDLARQADLVVLDHYGYDAQQIDHLYQLNPNLLVLDDNNNRGELHCRWVLNPLSLSYPDTVQYSLTGGQYALLRPQFSEHFDDSGVSRQKLLLTFGGTDPLNLTLPFVKLLSEKGFPSESLLVMVGSGVQNPHAIEDFCRQHDIDCQTAVNLVSSLMVRSRYAISAAGGTLFELACMGVPTHFIQVADNQKNALAEHTALGWCRATDFTEADAEQRTALIDQVVDQVIEAWHSDLKQCSDVAKANVDGHGAERVVASVLNSRLE